MKKIKEKSETEGAQKFLEIIEEELTSILSEQRPMFQETPNEFAYLDFKKWAYPKRGMIKKALVKALEDHRGDGTYLFLALWKIWYEWANKKAKSWSRIPNRGPDAVKFGRHLAIMMKKDNLVITRAGNKLTTVEGKINEQTIRDEYNSLKKQSISYLRREWSRLNKVGNPNSLDKEGLVSDILRAYHGDKAVNKSFGIAENKLNEALARGLKPLLTLGSRVSWNTMSVDALTDLSDKFDRIDDEQADDVASYLNMAIENKQDYKKGLATKALKAFNKACKDALAGKPVKSVFEGKLNEMDINDPILIAVRARATMLKKAKAAPKVKKISTKQYYKLMDKEIDLIQQMKDAAKDYERLDSEMNQEAGQKGDAWTDADANRYGGDLDKLQTKIEKLAKQKLAVKKQIMNYRIN